MADNTGGNNTKKELEDIGNELKSWGSPLEKITEALGNMFTQADAINKAFVDGRVRIQEMDLAVANAASGVIRLGGDISNVSETITQIALGSRRNVIATEEQVSKLYASSQILGTSAGSLVESFGEVGYEVSQIGPNIEESIGYIQSVGLNAKEVMEDVTANMGQMNRYQFEGGVTGLAKMAAQASMLRFDMRETFNLANRVLDPEGAIDTAAAFQRLGVSVGDLADPFQLMNQSINDPSGLQKSLVEVSKQFTYFDEETKSFKINPQGVLTLREMEKQTGVSAAEMSKMGLAAADLDRRISEINTAGLTIASEEDKQYLANIATMQDGKYVVTLEDGTKKDLQNLNQEEFDKLIEQQRNAPKTVEDIQRSQLGVLQVVEADVKAIAAKVVYGVASSKYVEGNVRGAERIVRAVTGSIEAEVPESQKVSEKLTSAIDRIRDLYVSKDQGKIDNTTFTKKLESIGSDIKSEARSIGPKGLEALKNIVEESSKKVTGSSAIEVEFRKLAAEMTGALGDVKKDNKVAEVKKTVEKVEPLTRESYFGTQNRETAESSTKTKTINSQVDFGGTITFKVDAPAGISEQQFKTYFESEEFKKMIYKYYEEKAKELEKK